MIIDSPYWVCHHDPDGIGSVDVHPSGRRLVTCGTSPQIKIWNLHPILDPAAEKDANIPKLLATLSEHQGSVLVARFNNSGTLLASGGNDNAVLLYKLHPGPATSKLGSGSKQANIENWKTSGALRGHQLDVTALSWSPNDTQLASCSMDGNISIYSVSSDGLGHLIHSIRGEHNGWVKGLAYDPLGSYLASQGRNGVKVWDVRNWTGQGHPALVEHMQEPFERTPEMAFAHRIGWSPEGLQLIAVNARSQGKPTICLFDRQTWTTTHMVGHTSSVVAAAANPKLFYISKKMLAARNKQLEDMKAGPAAAAAAAASAAAAAINADQGQPAEDAAGDDGFSGSGAMVMACGSNDRTMTIWCSELALPLMHCSQVHKGPIVDVAWTPDGYSLITTSNEDSIVVFRFTETELGRVLSEDQFREVLREEYGDAIAAAWLPTPGNSAAAAAFTAGAGNGVAAAAAAHNMMEDMELAALQAQAAAAAAKAAQAPMAVPPLRPPVAAPTTATDRAPAAGAAATAAGAAVNGLLERRLMPTGAGVTTGTLQPQQQQPGPVAAAAATANTRKRIQPEVAGAAPGRPAPAAKRQAVGAAAAAAGGRPQQQLQQQPGRTASTAAASSGWVLGAPAMPARLEQLLTVVVPLVPDGTPQQQQQQQVPVMMVAVNGGRVCDFPVADVEVHVGGERLWSDQVEGQVVALAGSPYFSAAATASGMLLTWRCGGNMLLPPLVLGCPPVKMEAQGPWQLLLVGADGEFVLLDFDKCCRPLSSSPSANLRPLMAAAPSGTTLRDAWLAAPPAPPATTASAGVVPAPPQAQIHTAVLSDGSGWMFHSGLGLWMSILAGSRSLLGQLLQTDRLVLSGDAERLRAAAAAANAAVLRPPLPLPPAAALVWNRKMAEQQLFKALQLSDAAGYQTWLQLLGSQLAQYKDNGRLKELAQDLLGPERWVPEMADTHPWRPTVLGLSKRRLLQQLVHTVAQAGLPLATLIQKALSAAEEHIKQHKLQQQQQSPAMYQQCGVSPALMRLSAQAAMAAAVGAGSTRGPQQPMQQVGPMNGVVNPEDGSAAKQAAATSHQWPDTAVQDAAASGQGQSVVRQPMQQPAPRRMQPVPVDGDLASQHTQQIHPQQPSSHGAVGDGAVGGREPLQALQPGQMPQVQHAELDKARTPSADNIATG